MFTKDRLSIDIRSNVIRVVEGSLYDDNTVKINKAAYLDLRNAVLRDGKLINCQDNVDIIKNFLRRNRLSCQTVLLNISDNKIITRVIKIPKLPLDDLKSFIQLEAPKYFPVDINSYLIDYKILDAINEEDKIYYNVLVCAVPKDIVREYVDLFISCGLKPILVDIHANSVYRIFENLEFEDIAIIDSSNDSVDFVILNKGIFYIYTTFSSEIPDYNDLYRSPQSYDISQIDRQIKDLSNNVKSYIDFYLSRNEGKRIDKVYITGDIAMIDGIEEKLMNSLKVDVVKGFNNLIKVKKPKKLMSSNDNFYASNIGIFLRGV